MANTEPDLVPPKLALLRSLSKQSILRISNFKGEAHMPNRNAADHSLIEIAIGSSFIFLDEVDVTIIGHTLPIESRDQSLV